MYDPKLITIYIYIYIYMSVCICVGCRACMHGKYSF